MKILYVVNSFARIFIDPSVTPQGECPPANALVLTKENNKAINNFFIYFPLVLKCEIHIYE
jgi:hypothetical protein